MDALIEAVITSCEAFMSDKEDALALPREAGAFVHTLIEATGATQALEIGTSYGYSGLWIGGALAAAGGHLTTIDVSPRKSAAARERFEEAGLADVVTCLTGEAKSIIPDLPGPFDFVLNDADKQNCRTYVEMLLPKLKRGAVVLTDNTLTHAEELADFMSWARSTPQLQSVPLPLGNGFEMSVRR